MANDVIKTAIDFLQRIRDEDEVIVKFTKKDGTERIMRCTLNFTKIPDRDKPKDVNMPKILNLLHKHKMIHVFDLQKRAWRTVPFDRAEWLETAEGRFRIAKT